MYKLIICATVLFAAPVFSNAQHIDKVGDDAGLPVTDELHSEPPANNAKAMQLLQRRTMLLNDKNVFISTVLSSRHKGDIVVNDGSVELLTAGFKRNSLHGKWQSRYSNGAMLDSGRFVNNVPDGEWKSWYSNGRLRTLRTYDAYKWEAVQNEINRGNTRIYQYRLSQMMNFNAANYRHHASAVHSFSTLPGAEEKYQPPFAQCFHHGLYMNYYNNGMVKDSGYYHNGLKDGLWVAYHSNGSLSAQGSYYRGAKHGGWKLMDMQGNLVALMEYKNGKLLFRKNYSKPGLATKEHE